MRSAVRCPNPMKMRTAVLSLALTSLSFTTLAMADVPPMCDQFSDRVTCAQADLGKPCATGGTCYEVHCAAGRPGIDPSQTLYKCEVCPPPLDAGACSSTYGAPCADDAGTCRKAPAWCPPPPRPPAPPVTGIACYGPTPELAPAAASPVADSDGGCSVTMVSPVSWRVALPSFLLSAGAFALFFDRRRRQRCNRP
jgi:hypothetical protein